MKIKVSDLSMTFNDCGKEICVFNSVNFSVESGQSVAIVGESGVGKTTLLNIISGLEIPVKGDIFIDNSNITDILRKGDSDEIALFRRENIGLIFQFHYLLPEFSAVENVAMPLIISGEDFKQSLSIAADLLKRVGLGHRLTHRPSALSGGEQQRTAIARALIKNPGVLLCDEPTGSLDIKTAMSVSELLLKIQREEKATLIVVTHSLELASKMDVILELTVNGIVVRK